MSLWKAQQTGEIEEVEKEPPKKVILFEAEVAAQRHHYTRTEYVLAKDISDAVRFIVEEKGLHLAKIEEVNDTVHVGFSSA